MKVGDLYHIKYWAMDDRVLRPWKTPPIEVEQVVEIKDFSFDEGVYYSKKEPGVYYRVLAQSSKNLWLDYDIKWQSLVEFKSQMVQELSILDLPLFVGWEVGARYLELLKGMS
jgi:hypothetical protein